MKKSKKKVIIAIAVLLIIVIIIAICRVCTTMQQEKTSVNDFKNIKQLLEYYDCKYIETNKSNEKEYKKDIYMTFGVLPITEEGISNQSKYEEIISSVSTKMNPNNYRIIDEQNNIIIRVNFTEDGTVTYIINNDLLYFEHLVSKYSVENTKEKNNTDFSINSRVLSKIINNNWKTINIDIGTIDSEIDKYDIYFDEGYKIRKVNGRVYNIVFTNRYNEAVLNDLYVNSDLEQVKTVLGKESYSSGSESANVIGYKNDVMYVFFSNGEISIYPNESGRDSDKFAELVSQLMENNNQKEFLSKLTDIWPDYASYTNSKDGVIIEYPLKGVKVDFTAGQMAQIIFYENYKGNITNNINIDSIKEEKNIPASYIKLSLNENNLVNVENNRASLSYRRRHPYYGESTINTNKYTVYLNSSRNECKFYSINEDSIDSYISVEGLQNMYEVTDTIFVYSISEKGIYAYDAENKRMVELTTGNEPYNIKEIRNYTIFYDDKQIAIN